MKEVLVEKNVRANSQADFEHELMQFTYMNSGIVYRNPGSIIVVDRKGGPNYVLKVEQHA